MSEYIHQDDAYEWVDAKRIEFAEQDFAKVQAERDEWKRIATMYFVPFHEGG
jgi:arsenate reductase-like glutaredoxin family protein